jgi:hypothetical protein
VAVWSTRYGEPSQPKFEWLDEGIECAILPTTRPISRSAAGVARGALARDDPEKAREAVGVLEAIEAADLGGDAAGGQRVDPAEAAQPGDRRLERAPRPGLLEREVERRAALKRGLDRRQVVDVDGPRGVSVSLCRQG